MPNCLRDHMSALLATALATAALAWGTAAVPARLICRRSAWSNGCSRGRKGHRVTRDQRIPKAEDAS